MPKPNRLGRPLTPREQRMCGGKVCHPSRKQANGMRRVMLARHGSKETLRPYHCRLCWSWHLGNTRPREVPAPVKTIIVSVTDIVEIVWRHPNGQEQRERRAAPPASELPTPNSQL